MIRNYITTAYRNLQRNKIYAILNIAGLALGIGCALVIYKATDYEPSFDTRHANYSNIYRVVRHTERAEVELFDSGASHPLAEAFRADFPNIKEVVSTDFQEDLQVNIKNEAGVCQRFLDESGVVFAQREAFKIFDVSWLAGNPEEALKNPNAVIFPVGRMEQFFGIEGSEAHQAMGRIVNIGA